MSEGGQFLRSPDTDDTTKTIDSPLANLALYEKLLNTGTLGNVTTDLGELAFLVDGNLESADLLVAASLFAAASDKSVEISVDAIVYMNAILGIDGALDDDFVDYTDFTYDREDVYKDLKINVLVETSPGVWTTSDVYVYDAVFGEEATGVLENVEAFTTAADDARLVIEFIHQYAPPET